MLRLVLAVRESDGDDLIPEETLDDLPTFRNPVADVLRHAGLTGAGMLRRGLPAVRASGDSAARRQLQGLLPAHRLPGPRGPGRVVDPTVVRR